MYIIYIYPCNIYIYIEREREEREREREREKSLRKSINSFHVNIPFAYPLKTSENLWFSGVFRGCRNRIIKHWLEKG